MVLFGELVIPSSRALWDEDFNDTLQENISLEWKGDASTPSNISNILIIETSKLNNIAISCLENESKPLCYLSEANVKIYKLKYNNYLVLCSEDKHISAGEITEMIVPWIERSEHVICVTSSSTAMYQKNKRDEMPACFIKSLKVKAEDCAGADASVLDVPNLVTGICAGAISYCHYINKSGIVYVCYTDPRPLDSITAKPILDLLHGLNIPTDRAFSFKPEFVSDSNLYM